VIGGSSISARVEDLAESVGKMIAELGCILVCGGLGGAMEAGPKGLRERAALTIGILPGKDKLDANHISCGFTNLYWLCAQYLVACSG